MLDELINGAALLGHHDVDLHIVVSCDVLVVALHGDLGMVGREGGWGLGSMCLYICGHDGMPKDLQSSNVHHDSASVQRSHHIDLVWYGQGRRNEGVLLDRNHNIRS